jgi:hypothetical protein
LKASTLFFVVSMSLPQTIYTGVWTNWSKGAVVGSTITLSNRNGAVLIAALAIFIQVRNPGML